jgi:hypothetical protein
MSIYKCVTKQRDPFLCFVWFLLTKQFIVMLVAKSCRIIVFFPKSVYKTPWSESASELYRPSGRRLSAKLVPTFADRGCHVVSLTDPCGRVLGFLDRSRYFFFQTAPQLYSRGGVDPVPDPLLLRNSYGNCIHKALCFRGHPHVETKEPCVVPLHDKF